MIGKLNFLKAYLAGFIFGSLITAGLALLYAPHSGAETRGMIRDMEQETQQRVQALLHNAQRRANQALSETATGAIDEASALLDRGQDALYTTRLKIETSR